METASCQGDVNGDGADDACRRLETGCCLSQGLVCLNVTPATCREIQGTELPGQCRGDSNNDGFDDACRVVIEHDDFELSEAFITLLGPDNLEDTIHLRGPTSISVHFVGQEGGAGDRDGDGLDDVQVKMVHLNLTGESRNLGPVTITLNPDRMTQGKIEELVNNTPGVLDVDPFAPGDADSFFDIFVLIDVGGQVVHNEQPKRMRGVIRHKPPAEGDSYVNAEKIELFDEAGNATGFFIGPARHVPNPKRVEAKWSQPPRPGRGFDAASNIDWQAMGSGVFTGVGIIDFDDLSQASVPLAVGQRVPGPFHWDTRLSCRGQPSVRVTFTPLGVRPVLADANVTQNCSVANFPPFAGNVLDLFGNATIQLSLGGYAAVGARVTDVSLLLENCGGIGVINTFDSGGVQQLNLAPFANAGPQTVAISGNNIQSMIIQGQELTIDQIRVTFVCGEGGPGGPNVVVADDFRSDGRPITCVRYWGSYLDPAYVPERFGGQDDDGWDIDSWLISFHSDRPAGDGNEFSQPETLLGLYSCPVETVDIRRTGFSGCREIEEVFEYFVELKDCCPIHTEREDPRDGSVPAQREAFEEVEGSIYWLDIQAVVGHTYNPVDCRARVTENRAAIDFWGWHSTPDAFLTQSRLGTVAMTPIDGDWEYREWQSIRPACPDSLRIDQAFELLAPIQPPRLVHIMDGLGPAHDTFISPLGEGRPFSTFTLLATEPLILDRADSIYTGSQPAPRVAMWVHRDNGLHVVTLDRPIEAGHWLKLALDVTGINTRENVRFMAWIASLPLDIDQSTSVNIRDATAFGEHFQLARRIALVDCDGNEQVDIRDATCFGSHWDGLSPATQAWQHTQLPPRP